MIPPMLQPENTPRTALVPFIRHEERTWNQVARALHDRSMQPLTAAQWELEQLKITLANDPAGQRQIEAVQEMLRTVNQSLRGLFIEMDTQTITQQGLRNALSDFATYLQRRYPNSAPISLSAAAYDEDGLTAEATAMAFRCLQRLLLEALDGHAAGPVALELRREDGYVVARLHCTAGARIQAEVWREWLQALGGQLACFPWPDDRLEIRVKLPVHLYD